MFPSFLCNLRNEDVDKNTIVRLTKLSELNMIRVFFRFLFTVPFLILSIDGIQPHHHINENMLWTDFLAMMGGFGCSISSAITLVIFFPRSIEIEIAVRDERRHRKFGRTGASRASLEQSRHEFTRSDVTQHSTQTLKYETPMPGSTSCFPTSSPGQDVQPATDSDYHPSIVRSMRESRWRGSMDKDWADEEQDILASLPPLRPNRKQGDDAELGGIEQVIESSAAKLDPRTSNVNHMVHNFTSPIDLSYNGRKSGITWLTLRRNRDPP
ncbi:hypothetical protein C0995_002457 [Termitomyces sp. Mi166|nr:hypothetical protein C0995_002457 [Termitomyces sp. Mi166\